MSESMRSKKEIQDLLNKMDEVEVFVRDPCVRAQMDSFASALRWVLNDRTIIKKAQEGT